MKMKQTYVFVKNIVNQISVSINVLLKDIWSSTTIPQLFVSVTSF